MAVFKKINMYKQDKAREKKVKEKKTKKKTIDKKREGRCGAGDTVPRKQIREVADAGVTLRPDAD